MSFDDLGLSPEVLKAIGDVGYSQPTPIQEQAIPYVLMGRDVLGCAQTGTGKTASFTVPMLDILASGRAKARMPRSLIIEPTRELAAQVAESFERYGKYQRLSMALLIGGSSFVDQERALDRGVDVLIATPGRLIDLFERGKIILADVKILVIDEADRMLDMGFIPDVEKIVSKLPKLRQTLFFSATMPPEIKRLADAFLMNPKEITVSPPTSTAATVEQRLLRVAGKAKEKRAALRSLIRGEEIASALVFCNRKRDVGILYRSLKRHGFDAAELHGDMAQPARMATLDRFKKGEVKILVCSDVAARGLDIPAVSHVFNFDVPSHAEDYIHRIGRTGRAGRSGKAFTLSGDEDHKSLAGVVRLIGRKIEDVEVEGVAAPEPGSETRDESDATRRRGRRRGGRGRDRERRAETAAPESGEAPAAEDDAIETTEEAPASEAPKEKRSRRGGRGRSKAPANSNRRPARAVEPDLEDEELAAGASSNDSGSNDSGSPFGDQTPAFLLRPVRLQAAG